MASPSAERLACRIVEETRLARLARHPRARIAHYMLADAYRALVNRMLLDGRSGDDATTASQITAAGSRYGSPNATPDSTGFLADRSA